MAEFGELEPENTVPIATFGKVVLYVTEVFWRLAGLVAVTGLGRRGRACEGLAVRLIGYQLLLDTGDILGLVPADVACSNASISNMDGASHTLLRISAMKLRQGHLLLECCPYPLVRFPKPKAMFHDSKGGRDFSSSAFEFMLSFVGIKPM
eukprot:1980034-Amphidinium_carterae.1